MKILVTSVEDIKRVYNSIRLQHIVRHLSENHDITILSTRTSGGAALPRPHNHDYFEPMFRRVAVIYLTKGKSSAAVQQVSFRSLDSILREIDLASFDLHINSQSLLPGYIVAKRLRKFRKPTVFDIADDLLERNRKSPVVPSLLRPLIAIIGPFMLKRNIDMATVITYITQALGNSYNLPQSKSVLVPNGVDTKLFRNYPSEQLRKELGLNRDFVIGFVGVLQWWVDFEPVFASLRELMAEYPDMKMLVVGEEGRLKENKELAQRYGIASRVVFTGAIPFTQVPKYISCMDVCLVPFKETRDCHNALPIKTFEYMACERPVISTRLAGVVEAVGDKVLYASSVEDYKSRLAQLYNDQQLRRRMGVEGRGLIEANYSWVNIGARFEKLLFEVTSG